MKTQWLYKISSALLIVMLAVVALPVTPAYAADTGWLSPTAVQSSQWVNATNAFSSDDTRASEGSDGDEVIYNGFGISIPAGNMITGIEVSLEGYTDNSRDVDVDLSWTDTSNNWTNAEFVNFTNTSSADETIIIGGSTDTWGESWSLTEAGVLRVRIITDNDQGTFFLDHVQVRVYYDVIPEMDVLGNGVLIDDGDASPRLADGTNWGNVGQDISAYRTFTIQNTGTAALTLGTITMGGSADFSVTTAPTSPVPAGESTTFVIRFLPTSGGNAVKNATFSIVTNDSNENPYNFSLTGTRITANSEIDIQSNGITITDGDNTPSAIDGTDFGSINTGSSITNTYIIYNVGSANLTLGAITIGGAQAANFSVITNPISPVVAGGSTTFQIQFTPSATGVRNATFSISTNDGSENPYNFSLRGTGVALATPTLSVNNSPVAYNGLPQVAVVTCSSGGAVSNILYAGSPTAPTNAGTYAVTADCAAVSGFTSLTGVTAGNSFVINQITPTASVSNTPQNYTGAAQSATVSCSGGGVASNISTGGAVSQTNAGTYAVTADCAASTNYIAAAGLAAGNFVINQLTPTVTVTNGPVDYDGSTHAATVSCLGGGVASNILTGGAASQTDAGTYPVTADCAASTNYAAASGVTAGNFVINQLTPTVTVTNGPVDYDGSTHAATVSCLGGGVASNILTGGAASQTDAGTYPVTADCAASTNYTAAAGLAAGNFVINQIAPIASVTNTPQNYTGAAQSATVSCVGGGVASNISTGGAASQTDAGTYSVTADCAASTNYTAAAGLAAGNFVINQLDPTLTVTNGPVDYDGSTHAATVSCLGGGVASNISTGGAASQTNAGTYPVTADCAASTNYAAASGVTAGKSFVINQIAPAASVTNTPQNYTGAAQSATVSCVGGGVASNISTGGAASQTDAGTYPVTADCAASTNYTAAAGLAAGNFVINQIAPTASVTNTPQNYTGAPQSAAVSCSGGGVASNILTGEAASQTDVGTYAVTADCAASTNYTAAAGLAAGNFAINNVGQTINVTISAPTAASNGSTFDVAANATSGLFVTITTSGSCSGGDTDGTATITMTSGTGTCSVFYDQAGDKNYSAAPQVQEDVTATEGPVFTSANTTSFDAGFAGTFNITATGNPSTMVISEAGALPSGITLVDNGNGTAVLSGIPAIGSNGTYNLVLTANNSVAPNGTQNFTLIVKNGPVIGANGVNSTPDTGDGSVSENESIIDTLGITKLTVQFSQDVNDPEGDTDVKDVTNPANYLLVRSTAGVFATIDCKGGVVAPDIAISVDSVTYSDGGGSGPFIATLSVNGSLPLNVIGFYRLYVCGTTSIVDAVNTNLILAGNGTTPGTDFQRSFRVATAVVTTVGGGGGGAASSNVSKTVVTSSFLIPVTGFAPNQTTTLPVQPVEKAYSSLGQMTIEIPTLGIKFPIVGASIANKTWDLTWLKDDVAYLEGSAYPTTAGNTVLTAHVQDANKNLGPFSDIKGMQLGQKIYIHVNGQIYVYQVQENDKISTNNISAMFKHEEDSWITLVTCEDYNAKTGLYNSRRMVRAVLISVIPEKK